MADADPTGAKPKRSLFGRLLGRTENESAPTPDALLPEAPQPAESVIPDASAPEPVSETPPITPDAPEPPPKLSWWKRLREGLSRSSQAIGGGINDIFSKRKLDADTLQELEDVLIRADLGATASLRITEAVAKGRYDKNVSPDEVKNILATEIESVLEPLAQPLEIDRSKRPFVILVIGVNGSGKTTTIGKLAAKFSRDDDLKVLLAAGDTFRAAAIEQLRIWGCASQLRGHRARERWRRRGPRLRRLEGRTRAKR